MKKKYRLLKNENFRLIMKKGKKVKNNVFRLYYLKKQKDYAKIGISVSKKLGNAVKRNKIKRQLKVIIKENINFLQFKFDVVLIPLIDYKANKFWKNYEFFKTTVITLNKERTN